MTSGQDSLPVASSIFRFDQHGQRGTWLSELIPHHGKIIDDIALVKTVYTEAINHDPAITFMQTGSQQPGRPSTGAWISYGLGSENRDLPAFVVLISQKSAINNDQPLFSRLWGSGFLPSAHQGVRFRASGDPVLYLADPPGMSSTARRRMLDGLAELNRMRYEAFGDPEIDTRIQQYEMAYRMQTSVPSLMDLSDEPDHTFELYGPSSRKPGTYAANCLLARRLAERGVRFIQLYHRGWDQHNDLPRDIALQCKDVDQPSAALILDLKQRGMLDDTIILWTTEFGRMPCSQGSLGRDHNPFVFTNWLAGGGIAGGTTFGESDEWSYKPANPNHALYCYDIHATVLHLLGIDHEKLTYRHNAIDRRLTDVHGHVIKQIIT
jgi:hypothetical protein